MMPGVLKILKKEITSKKAIKYRKTSELSLPVKNTAGDGT